ncbi:RraA family protein [Alcaligenes endophyticus]|uniref:Putative 4-hydroxy-4-methyl-2-oxoglutarate aldolase n=1 Tax=Alcaligenes endophyticus TaxID=1929088 RepID=A0ABT8EL42_9BURK|nr:RraA family protein [Alcaligenes endophyticus]MCX5590632.1 RraA family protein [Alcaligenes endophyticus]MDN4122004.1 RraA family protein [Alcaligenes endophyticus]
MQVAQADWLSSTLLADRGARVLASRIKPLKTGWVVHGRALPVAVPAGDNLAIHAALSVAQAGEVLVVDGGNYTERALMGGIMCHQAQAVGLAGVVIDGAVRDAIELRQAALPVFASALSPAGPYKHGPGSVFKPVSCGGVSIQAGDWIYGDDDGVVVFTEQEREPLLQAAYEKWQQEQARMQAIDKGVLEPAWLRQELAQAHIDIAPRPMND